MNDNSNIHAGPDAAVLTGADILLQALTGAGIDVCFGNPGTSEMSFLASLDRVGGMRCVLGLQENIVTGAADGYYRMAGRPAATLLHLGPGLTNGAANLHNARKARSGIVNVIGEHATAHLAVDSPLKADLDGLARPVSDWVGRIDDAARISALVAQAVDRASGQPPQVTSLLLHGDAAWSPAGPQESPAPAVQPTPRRHADIGTAVRALRDGGDRALLLLGGRALRALPLELAARIGQATGCKVATCFGIPRIERGAGRHAIHRLPYAVDLAVAELARYHTIVTVHSAEPIGFFGYPGKPSLLRAPDSRLIALCEPEADPVACLADLAEAVGGRAIAQAQGDLAMPSGALTPETIAAAIAFALPDQAIVIDESLTTGRLTFPLTAGARPHDWLQNLGGAIGFGTPAAVGAAVACPDRPVLCLAGDGSFMMTPQALWTQAREGLNIVNVVFANREYKILRGEVANVGAGPLGPVATSMLRIDAPVMDFAGLARSLGLPAVTVRDAGALAIAMQRQLSEPGPSLIEVECPA